MSRAKRGKTGRDEKVIVDKSGRLEFEHGAPTTEEISMGETVAAMGLLGFVMSFMFFWVIWYVLVLIARWKVFDKAGIAGWKSLIPLYSDYCTYKIAWKTMFFWIFLAGGFISGIVSNQISSYRASGDAVPMLLSLVSTVLGVAVAVINLMMNLQLAQKFGHGIAFGLGLTFLTPIFTMILAFGESDYYGNPEEGLPPRRRMYM